MTEYNPPVENVPIFDASLFSTTNKENEYLTRENADSLYLHYPFAQGTETFPQNIILSGTTNTNYIQYPDGSKQYTAPSTQKFQPVFVNYTDYQTGTSGYSQGPTVSFNGTWYANDWVMLRICQQGSYDKDGNGDWQGYASSYGTMVCRPFYMPNGGWASIASQTQYTNNSGNYMGPVKKPLYYSANTNQGTNSYFCIYANSKNVQFLFINKYTSNNGWSTSIEIEYIASTGDGTVSFTNGTGTNSTNNSLP
jgi:hypothetical protein